MRDHFFSKDSPSNRVRFSIFQLMTHFEEMYDVLDELLNFLIKEEKAKDLIEEHLIEMQKLHIELTKNLKVIEADQSEEEKVDYETSLFYEGVRRTFNFLTGLNVIDLDADNWVPITKKCIPDKNYYRVIKSLVFHEQS